MATPGKATAKAAKRKPAKSGKPAPARPAKAAKAPKSAKAKPKPRAAPRPRPNKDSGEPGETKSPRGPEPVFPGRAAEAPAAEAAPAAGWEPIPEAEAAASPPSVAAPASVAQPMAAAPSSRPLPARPAFDPATGAWLRPLPQALAAAPAGDLAPDAPRTGTTRKLVWDILLYIDLGLLALNFLLALVLGGILLLAPGSSAADDVRDAFDGGSSGSVAVETLLTFTMMGVVPFLWVLFTRRQMWEGTKRYLQLHSPLASAVLGIVLTAVLLVAVAVLSLTYVVLTEGRDGIDQLSESEEGGNPAVDALLANLTWPLAILISVCAGVGEEILFRGVLYRKLGLWPQAILFGLAHAAGGYLPQVLFALGLGIFFGYLRKRGVTLGAMIVAHTLYDLTLLSIALVFG